MKHNVARWLNHPTVWLFVLVLVVLTLNVFRVSFGMDFIVVTLAVMAAIRRETVLFLRDWLPPVALFYLYEATRAFADEVGRWWGAPFLAEQLIWAEQKLFFWMKEIPTVWLQFRLRPELDVLRWYDYVLFFFYSMFFWYWMLVGFIIWRVKRQLFKPYMYGLVGFSLVDVILYALFLSAPPWWAAQQGLLPYVERILWTSRYLPAQDESLKLLGTYGHNDFAALPSHHAAWPLFASLFLVKVFGRKALPTLLIPLVVAFSTWYGAEHYVVDSLLGWAIAGFTFWLVTRERVQVKAGQWFRWRVPWRRRPKVANTL